MARNAEGWRLVARGRIQRVRFTYARRRYEITTGESDPGKAAIIAAQIYADVISGRVTVSHAGVLMHPSTPLNEVCADWIAAIEPELGRDTGETYTVYARHWSRFFGTLSAVNNSGNISNYSRERLKSVQRETVIKELVGLRRFLSWCVEQGVLRLIPVINPPSKKATGKKHPQGRKPPMPLSPAQAEAILAKIPERSRKRGGFSWPLRGRFVFAYETGLRPEMIDQLVERDLTAFGLHIRPEIDKNRWERTIPLSARALAVLEGLKTDVPEASFFGSHDRRETWRNAAIAALGAEDGKRTTPYDLKHARVTKWRSEGKDPMGIQFLTGVTEAIEEYMHPNRTAAERVLWGDSGAIPESQCEGRDSNPHRSYPTSTSSECEPQDAAAERPSASGDHARNGDESAHSGAPPQITPEDFRARSAAWFRRAVA